MRYLLLAAVLGVLGSPAVSVADFQAGVALAEQGRFASAIHEWRNAAEQGDAESQFALGLAYERGQGVAQNVEEAFKWHRLAAEGGLQEAQLRLAQLYMAGVLQGGTQEALRWYERAANAGEPTAQFMLGLLYLEGNGVEQSATQAAQWFQQAANQGHSGAQNNLGGMHERGLGVEQDFARAFEYYELAAKQGDAMAQNNLGAMYAHGRGVESNHAWAVFWFAMAASNGNEQARENIEASLPNLQHKAIGGSRVNIRSGPGTEHSRVAQLERAQQVYVLGAGGGWSQIYFEQAGVPQLGWVASNLIE